MLPNASLPQLLPEFGHYPAFPMHAYPDEPAATGPYVKYLQVNRLSMFAAIIVTWDGAHGRVTKTCSWSAIDQAFLNGTYIKVP